MVGDIMYKLIPWHKDLDLTEFYKTAADKGFVNNSSQQAMIDCFKNEQRWQCWILYYKNKAVGSVAAHSLDIIPGYRICARTCVFTDELPLTSVRTRNEIKTHQHITAQFFMPACIEWAGIDEPIYITTHASKIGTQRLVHNVWGPSMAEVGVVELAQNLEYRGHVQSFWKVNVLEFQQQLDLYPRW